MAAVSGALIRAVSISTCSINSIIYEKISNLHDACGCGRADTGCKPVDGTEEVESRIPGIEPGVEEVEILAAGGEFSIPYTLAESYDDGVLSADCEADWISFLSCGESEVTFVAEANEELEPRSATVVLCYTYGEERDTVTARVSAVQAAADEPESEYDFEFNATDFSGTYFGNIYGQNGEYCFDAYLMDQPMDGDYFAAGTTAYLFDMFTTAPGDSKNPRPAPGTYMLGELYATASMTFTPDLSCRMYQNEDGTVTRTRFSDGTLTISEEGGNVIFEAFLTDENGKTHHVTYSGPTNYVSDGVVSGSAGNYTIECSFTTAEGYSVKCSYSGDLTVRNIPEPISTLTGDYTLNLSGATGYAEYYGDYYGTGGGNWIVSIETEDEGFMADIVVDGNDFSGGIVPGVYVAAALYPSPGEYAPGRMSYTGQLTGTMYYGGYEGEYVTEFAPAVSGDLVIDANADGTYSVSFSFYDDKDNVWDGEWTGIIETVDASGYYGARPASMRAEKTGLSGMTGNVKFRPRR